MFAEKQQKPVRTYAPIVVAPMTGNFDFETYSEAGYYFDEATQRWRGLQQGKPGIAAVGAAVYAEHPSTIMLCVSWDLGTGNKLWVNPRLTPEIAALIIRQNRLELLEATDFGPSPIELIAHVTSGGLMSAYNSMFEYLIWNRVCCRTLGWPPLPLGQLRCAQSQAKAFGLPSTLEKAAIVLNLDQQKGLGN